MIPILPNAGSQEWTVLMALGRGESLTMLEALQRYNIMALSQRITRLKDKFHWPIESEIVKTATATSNKRVARYWMAK